MATTSFINIQAKTYSTEGTVRRLNVALWESDGTTQVSCNRYIGNDDDVSVGSTSLTPGNTYYISIDNNYSGYRGSFTLCVTDEADYDYYEGAIELTDLNNWCSADAEYTTSGATADKNAASCWNTSPYYNRWFKFTAISPNLTVEAKTFDTEGTVRRLQLALWESDGTTQIACQRYVGNDDDVSISVGTLTAGNEYYISVDNNYSGYRGTFTLCVNNIDGTYYSRQSGPWTDPNTWSTIGFGGAAASDYPQTGDVANIQGNTVSISGNETIAELFMNAAGGPTDLNITGNLIIQGKATMNNPGNNNNSSISISSGTMTVGDDFAIYRDGGNAAMSVSIDNSSVTFNKALTINSTAGGSFGNTISISNSSSVTVNEDLELILSGGVKNLVTLDNSTLTVLKDVVFTSSADDKNEITLSNGAILNLKKDVVRGTPAYGILNCASGTTVNFNSDDYLQVFPSSSGSGTGDEFTYQNVTINNSRITTPQITLDGPVTINESFTLANGEVKSTSSNLLTIVAGATISGGSANSFVDGPLKKIGNTDFEFPVGNNNFWQPISIANLAGDAATEFTAQYFEQTPTDDLNLKSPDPNGDLYNISGLEYWELSNTGTSSTADITLFWKDQSRSDIDDAADLQIAHYTGSEWENLGQSSINFADPGSITVTGVTSFSPFTFGSMSSSVNALPVELVSFTGVAYKTNNVLSWQTASELNNDYFEVQKSLEGKDFQTIGLVKGIGTSSTGGLYSFTDYEPAKGIQYYRLKQVDYNGDHHISNTILVRSENSGASKFPALFPNPVSGDQITLSSDPNDQLIELKVLDGMGKLISIPYSEVNQNKWLLNISNLDKGMYLIQIETLNGITGKRFIKQ